jgi:hypothetical protein
MFFHNFKKKYIYGIEFPFIVFFKYFSSCTLYIKFIILIKISHIAIKVLEVVLVEATNDYRRSKY